MAWNSLNKGYHCSWSIRPKFEAVSCVMNLCIKRIFIHSQLYGTKYKHKWTFVIFLIYFFLIPICSYSNFTVLKVPGVKKTLGIPEIPVAAPTSAPQSPFSIFPALKQATSAANAPSSAPGEPSTHSNKKISSSSVISQRLRSLEKQVKGRKKNKKWGKFTGS